MPNATAIINKINRALNRVGPPPRLVYKRTVTRSGGDPLLGYKGSVSAIDTLLSPQPYYKRVGRVHEPGGHADWFEYIDSNGKERLADDFKFIFSPSSITRGELQDSSILIVLKDQDGSSEVYRPTDIVAPAIYGSEAAFIVFMRLVGEVAG